MRVRTVTVKDRMQQGYVYALVEPDGRNFNPEFRTELTPAEMLKLGVFGGKYLTDCRDEFPASSLSTGQTAEKAYVSAREAGHGRHDWTALYAHARERLAAGAD